MARTAEFRRLLATGGPIVAPGATDAFTARLIEAAGFEVVYVTGGGMANTFLGAPDIGLVTQMELASHAKRISDAVSVPVFADCDTGFGGVANVRRSVKEYEAAGLAGLHIEDQRFPKRCGHFENKAIVPADEMLYRLQAALDARTDPDFVIIARTDARAVEGFEAALARAQTYRDIGADVLFIEAPQSIDELRHIGERFRGIPLVANIVENGKTPIVPAVELARLGFNLIIYANSALRLGAFAIRAGLKVLREAGSTETLLDRMITFEDRQLLVGLAQSDDYERDLVARVQASKKHVRT